MMNKYQIEGSCTATAFNVTLQPFQICKLFWVGDHVSVSTAKQIR